MKRFLIGGLIGGSVVMGAVVLLGSTSNRSSEVPTIVGPSAYLMPAGGTVQKTVSCPAGKYTTGFGFSFSYTGGYVRAALPTSDGTGYEFVFNNPSTSQLYVGVRVICM